ncbi:hypothetical protein FRACA_420010 [Frankia canadensis]|uniref:Uncharacterized protein n=1 Tax=Frankia canadensis TaxID=1836972 RepID=A0A2I2KX20_9ACTN|nr:hypothetical protein FRACA_420010 [Frankia canadensis]SOU57499.1 hypothetical protein FRACA_420010 [Frankia canadensis]
MDALPDDVDGSVARPDRRLRSVTSLACSDRPPGRPGSTRTFRSVALFPPNCRLLPLGPTFLDNGPDRPGVQTDSSLS